MTALIAWQRIVRRLYADNWKWCGRNAPTTKDEWRLLADNTIGSARIELEALIVEGTPHLGMMQAKLTVEPGE